jgi:F420-non-reducing hydrogenase large subunit
VHPPRREARCRSQSAQDGLRRTLTDDEITSDEIHVPPTSIAGEGAGIVEAPRGLLAHHCKTDEKGLIKEANLIVGTTNNNAANSMSIKEVTEGLIRKRADVRHGMLDRIERRVERRASGTAR